MSALISNLMGKLAQFQGWKSVRQFLVIGIAPILFIGAVYTWQVVSSQNSNKDQVLSVSETKEIQTADQDTSAPPNTQSSKIFIDISGAVNMPGIKELAVGARVNDAIWSAQGYTLQADKQYLAQVLNLAQPLKDGDKIYIPTLSEVANLLPEPPIILNKIKEPINVMSGSNKSNDEGENGAQVEGGSAININTASQVQLEELPGIGEVNAKNIINGRPYSSTAELCTNKIITNATTCEKIQNLITI